MVEHGKHRPLVMWHWLAVVFFLASVQMAAACRLALVVALDVSSSVDAVEDALQRRGLAAALRSPQVRAAVFAGDPIAVAVFEWSGRQNQTVIVDWKMLQTPSDLQSLADEIARSTRRHNAFPTAMGYALGYGANLLARAPSCLFHTIDVAGDGQNNEGFGPQLAYREFAFDYVTVNGLVVETADTNTEVSLRRWYQTEVLHGPGAFVEVAQGYADYEAAMRRKLEREIRPQIVGALQHP
jgi:hypothetical protein